MLIVDDEPNIRRTIEMIHRNAGWQTASAGSGPEALDRLARESFDVIYLDLGMPDRDGVDVLRDVKERWPEQVVVILTGQGTIERAVEATRLGAFDFLEKDCGKDRILLTSKNALERATLTAENRRLRERAGGKREFLGRSRAAAAILQEIAKVAPTHARVLIAGESGTGKELIAQAIHDRSPRAKAPFVKVNCAAIPEELIEAELFGSVRGAYTGSVQSREGKFQAADGGTVFLDEVGDMSLKVQTKVLRVLQEGEIQRVGSDEVTRVDVRVIAATNKHLAEEVAAGRFREDLYYRLNVVPIVSPPLRERAEDIPLMVEAFLREYCAANDLPPKSVEPDVMRLLERYPWPGNVRELRNQVERMVIMCPGRTVRAEDVSAEIRAGVPSVVLSRRGERVAPEPTMANAGAAALPSSPPSPGPAAPLDAYADLSLQDARKRFERDLIVRALERHRWNVSRTADELGLERTNLHKKMKALGIDRE
jgi:two-component system nitrogen regulation response regulator NtrX